MKLHLPKKFQTALMAAIATVSFSTVSTATLAAAAFTFAGYQAAADETADAPELTSEEKEAEEKLNEEMEDSIQAQEEEEKEESKLTTHAIDLDAMKNLSNRFERGGDGASHQLAQQAYAAMEVEVFTPEAAAAPQQQATATSGELPSDDLSFTTNPYATSSTGNSGPVFEVTPAAPAADFLQDSPAETRSYGSTSGATSPAPVSASGFGGGASAGYSPSGYAAPAVRPLSVSVAPTALAAPASVEAPAAVAAPVEVAAPSPKLAATDTPPEHYIFSFNNGIETVYYTDKKDFYDLEVKSGDTGIIQFSTDMRGTPLTVEGDFKMTGEKFTIDTNGVSVTFAQSLSNYGTDITVIGGGTIETEGDAAFKSINIQNGSVVFDSRVGVTDKFTIGASGSATITEGSTMLFTQRIHNEGTLSVAGTIDASNISHEEAVNLQIQLEDKSGNHGLTNVVPNGYIYGDGETAWNIFDDTSTGSCSSTGGKLMIGTAAFNIDEGGIVHNSQTQYQMWLQNEGTESVVSVLDARKEKGIAHTCDFMVRGGATDSRTVLDVDMQLYDSSTVYVARNAVATINMSDNMETFTLGAVGKFKVLDGADVQIHSFDGESARMNEATFIGQGIQLTSIEKYDPNNLDFSPLVLTVEDASAARISANIHCSSGYFNGQDAKMEQTRRSGDYVVKGALTIASGFVLDMTVSERETSSYSTFVSGEYTSHTPGAPITNLVFTEEFGHLTIAEEGRVILEEGASFKANTVQDAEDILDSKGNLDTRRTSESSTFDSNLNPVCNGTVKYTLNGTMQVAGREGGAIITAAPEAEHYTTRNKLFTISNANIVASDAYRSDSQDKTGTGDTTISNALIGDSVINDKQSSHGKVTLDNSKNQNFMTIHAKEGDIAITNREAFPVVIDDKPTWKLEDVMADTVQIGASRTVSATGTIEQELQNTILHVNTLLKADGGSTTEGGGTASKVKADLVLNQGATIDVSAAGGKGGLNLTGTLTINEGAMLSTGDIANLMALEIGESYDLAFGVVDVNFGGDVVTVDDKLEASTYFANLYPGEFYLCYTGVNGSDGSAGKNVGTVYLYKVMPEPTTSTLSLLALAALAARRRRK